MKRSYCVGIVVVAAFALMALWRQPSPGNKLDVPPDLKASAAPLVELAEQHEAQGEFEAALGFYLQVRKARPRWQVILFKIANCQAAVGKKEEAAKTLRELVEMESVPVELLTQARAALQELLLPKLSTEQRNAWKQAVSLVQAGGAGEEQLKQHHGDDLEIRTEQKLFARQYREAIKLLEKLVVEVPDFAPAHLSLALAHDGLLNFKQAADGFRNYLEWGTKNKLPDLEQQAQIRQRLIVCQRRYQIDVELAKRIPGRWEASYDRGVEATTTTTIPSTTSTATSKTTTNGETSTTKTTNDSTTTTAVATPAFRVSGDIKLLQGGKAAKLVVDPQSVERVWQVDPDTYWKVVGRQLIIGGFVGKPTEWCDLGPLAPSGNRFDGLTMDLHRTRYVKQDFIRESPNKLLRATIDDNTVTVTDAKTGKELHRLSHEFEVVDLHFNTDLTFWVMGVDGNKSLFEAATGVHVNHPGRTVWGGRDDEGWVQLFNGKNKEGWKVHPDEPGDWTVIDGVLIGKGAKDSRIYTTRGDYGNFHFRIEARINDRGQSGQWFRSAFLYLEGYMAAINSTAPHPRKTGSLLGQAMVTDMLVPPNTWFTQEVIAKGNHIVILVNGKKVVDFVDTKNTYTKGHFAIHHFGADHIGAESIIMIKKAEVKELPDRKDYHEKANQASIDIPKLIAVLQKALAEP